MYEFPANSRIVCLGDSYTVHGFWPLELQRLLGESLPERRLRVFQCGIGGHTMGTTCERVSWDLTPYHPTHVIVLLGANDAWYFRFRGGYGGDEAARRNAELCRQYEEDCRHLIGRVRALTGAEVLLCTPVEMQDISPEEQKEARDEATDFKAVNRLLREFAEIIRRVAAEERAPLLDIAPDFRAAKEIWQDGEDALYAPDHVHPSVAGYRILARCVARAIGLPLSPITRQAELDALPFSPVLLQKKETEGLIRCTAHIRFDTLHSPDLRGAPQDIVTAHWLDRRDAPDCPAWLRNTIRAYLIWLGRQEVLFDRMERLTEACLAR